MKKILILACLAALAWASVARAGDFRNVEWGMSVEEVRAVETGPLEEEVPDVPGIVCLFGRSSGWTAS